MANKKLKIAILNITQETVNRGGEVFVFELSKRLEKNHKVDIFSGDKAPTPRWPIFWRFFMDPNGIQVLLFTIKSLPAIWREKYDIIIPLNSGWQPSIIRIITWIYGGKMVIAGQSGIGWDDFINIYSLPNTFVGVSQKAKAWCGNFNPFIKSVYIPNGVDLKSFSPNGPKYKTKLKPPIILCVGALVPKKQIDLTIKAVSLLENTSLLVAGKGPLKGKLQKLGKNLLGKKFELTSSSHKDIPKFYRSANLFTLAPKNSESFGIVFTEALASNLPVVTIDDDIRHEIVGQSGIFIPDLKDPQNYANALKKALSRKWGNLPHKQAEKYDWDDIAAKYEKLFSDLKK